MQTTKVTKRDETRVKTFRLSETTMSGLDYLAKLFGLSSRTEVIRFLVNREMRKATK